MSDIVERLRSSGAIAIAKYYSIGMADLCEHAANEIERLNQLRLDQFDEIARLKAVIEELRE